VLLVLFFASGVMFMWSGDPVLASHTAPIATALVLGTFLNALMWMPHQCQLALGWSSLALKTNVVAVLLLVPAIIWVVPRQGAVGAAWLWVLLNAGYVLIALQFMHARLLRQEKWRWYLADVSLPILGATAVTLVGHWFQPAANANRWQWLAFLLVTGGLATVAAGALAGRLRQRALLVLGSLRAPPRLRAGKQEP
jgi:O-antigen/teichoic acid export membrane protein